MLTFGEHRCNQHVLSRLLPLDHFAWGLALCRLQAWLKGEPDCTLCRKEQSTTDKSQQYTNMVGEIVTLYFQHVLASKSKKNFQLKLYIHYNTLRTQKYTLLYLHWCQLDIIQSLQVIVLKTRLQPGEAFYYSWRQHNAIVDPVVQRVDNTLSTQQITFQ